MAPSYESMVADMTDRELLLECIGSNTKAIDKLTNIITALASHQTVPSVGLSNKNENKHSLNQQSSQQNSSQQHFLHQQSSQQNSSQQYSLHQQSSQQNSIQQYSLQQHSETSNISATTFPMDDVMSHDSSAAQDKSLCFKKIEVVKNTEVNCASAEKLITDVSLHLSNVII